MEEKKTKTYNRKQKSGNPNFRKSVDSEVRKFEGELRPLMTEAEKKEAQVLELSYDFSCRIIRLYKYLNEGKLSKADRDIIDALGRQLVRAATSINANMNEAQHPQRDAKIMFIMGKGFDPRMNNTLKMIFEHVAYQSLSCLAVDFPAQEKTDGDEFYKQNVAEFEMLMKEKGVPYQTITIDAKFSWDNRIKSMLRQLNQIDYTAYTDIILDVSAIPCAYYYNIAKLLYAKTRYDQSNFFITVSENVEIDKLIKKKYNEETITPLYNFRASYGMESVFNPINIFVPLMGEDKKEHLKLVYDTFHPKEVCPVLPFPSKEPGRSDQLLWEYNDFLTNTLKVEPQNLLYAPERDPFELYNRLEKLMNDYKATLRLIDGQICFGFALLTSKLLALGVLLIGLKYENEVQVYNVNSSKYDIADKKKIIEANGHSEPFLMWINGEPYV